ncbi:MAG TPA: prepilin-type N-terminal cleavage/methylation domain-containing protein [Acetivibrio sp.]|nr:prepilin-type N-terminal cleavage/methylation domain-containing protein [Acetivibrio sp.]
MPRLGNKGFTLAEMMAAIIILGIIIVPVSLAFYTGYRNYFIENEEMTAQEKAREIIEMIITDLRMYENEHTVADNDSNTLTIKDSTHFPGEEIVYTYSPEQKCLFRNGIELFAEVDSPEVTDFAIEETRQADYDSSIIIIEVSVKYNRSDTVKLRGSFRRKFDITSLE